VLRESGTEKTSAMSRASVGEVLTLASGLRALGAAGFKWGDFEMTFYEPLPLEMQRHEVKQRAEGFESSEDDEEESAEDRLKRLRKAQADADLFGSS
jgi:hypothetical protein